MAAEAARNTGRFELAPLGPYSIPASARFLEWFAPAHYEGGGPGAFRAHEPSGRAAGRESGSP